MKKYLHFVQIPFTGVGLFRGYRGDEWFKSRIELFLNTTCKSLENQTAKNQFILWLTFRPEERNHPYVKELVEELKKRGLRFVCTFHGLMYRDDKFSKNRRVRYWNIRRVIRSCRKQKIPIKTAFPNILELFRDRNRDLYFRLARSLAELAIMCDTTVDYVYVTRWDSDDMMHSQYIETIQKQEPFAGVWAFRNGYVYNVDTKELAEWNPKTNPPFFTVSFPGKTFFDPLLHLTYWKTYDSHEQIYDIWPVKEIEGRYYMVGIHDPKTHISTTWNHPFRGPIIIDKNPILKEFGIILS